MNDPSKKAAENQDLKTESVRDLTESESEKTKGGTSGYVPIGGTPGDPDPLAPPPPEDPNRTTPP